MTGDADPLSDGAVARTRAHPRLRAAAEAMAASALTTYQEQDAASRWLLSDLGRTSLYWGAVILDNTSEGLTPAGLIALAATSGSASRGRAIAFLQYAESRGLLNGAPGDAPWSRRRLSPTPAFFAPLRRRMREAIAAAALVAPEAADALPRLQSDAGVTAAVGATAALTAARPELGRRRGGAFRAIFLPRDAGMRLLQELMLAQPAGRSRLLETALINRSALARRHRVSRTHVNRLLAEAEAAGALSLDGSRRVVFAPAFSDDVEAYYAGMVQVLRVVAASLVAAPGLSAA